MSLCEKRLLRGVYAEPVEVLAMTDINFISYPNFQVIWAATILGQAANPARSHHTDTGAFPAYQGFRSSLYRSLVPTQEE